MNTTHGFDGGSAAGLVALGLCVGAPWCPRVRGHRAASERAADAAAFKEFTDRVQAYVKLQKTVESSLPAMKPTDVPEMIAAHQQALARRSARRGRTRRPATCSPLRHARRFATPADARSRDRTRPARART